MNEPEYVENYGDQFSAVQMIFYIAKKSIFINFIKNIKNRIFYIFRILKKRGGGPLNTDSLPWVVPEWDGGSELRVPTARARGLMFGENGGAKTFYLLPFIYRY